MSSETRPETPEPWRSRFMADAMLGGLAKILRAVGVDVAYDPELHDAALVERAVAERRTILTRDRRLVLRRAAKHHLLVGSENVDEQLGEVLDAFGLEVGEDDLFSRCLRCNEPLEPLDPELARSRVPPYVARTQDRFSECPACERVYWAATHVDRMRRRLAAAEILPDRSEADG